MLCGSSGFLEPFLKLVEFPIPLDGFSQDLLTPIRVLPKVIDDLPHLPRAHIWRWNTNEVLYYAHTLITEVPKELKMYPAEQACRLGYNRRNDAGTRVGIKYVANTPDFQFPHRRFGLGQVSVDRKSLRENL